MALANKPLFVQLVLEVDAELLKVMPKTEESSGVYFLWMQY